MTGRRSWGPPASAPYSDEPDHRAGIRGGSTLLLRDARGRGAHRCYGGRLPCDAGGRPCFTSGFDESRCWSSGFAPPRDFFWSSSSSSARLPFCFATARTWSSAKCSTSCRVCSQHLPHIAAHLHGHGTRGDRYMVRSTLFQGASFRNQGILQQVGHDPRKSRYQTSNCLQMNNSRH